MVAKVRMTHTVELFIEGETEDDIQDWMNNHTPEEVVRNGKYNTEDFDDEIICWVSGDPDVVVEEEE